jgi:hypothetical protein
MLLPWRLEAVTTANGKNKRKQMPRSVLKLLDLEHFMRRLLPDFPAVATIMTITARSDATCE